MSITSTARTSALLFTLVTLAAAGFEPSRAVDVNASEGSTSPAILLEGTIVTMNSTREVIQNGRVLVRDGRIVAVWNGANGPADVDLAGAVRVPLGPHAYIYPGLINLHDHPVYSAIPLWQPPASHQQPEFGRPQGTEPYANRYQWNSGLGQPEEAGRLVANASMLLTQSAGLDRSVDVVKFGKARMILGGTTTTQAAPSNPAYNSLLSRSLEGMNFGRQRIFSRVGPIGSVTTEEAAMVTNGMSAGLVDAWLVHLAEGVRDSDRRPGDTVSSRAEFAELKSRNLLTDATVIVHGVGLEPEDFFDMAQAPAARSDGIGDSRGAKLVWSPLSNLLLYGQTTSIYHALAAGVLVSLGTDWSPSGSANLLTELKIADRALRDPRLLGARRGLFGVAGHEADDGGAAERALDRLLVEMVTTNPATSIRWNDQVGSIEVGKVADLLVIARTPTSQSGGGIPQSPYRRLIDATEQDVALVMVEGIAQAGDVNVMATLKPGDFEVITSAAGCFDKAIDVTELSLPQGSHRLLDVAALLAESLQALGSDGSQVGDGPSSPSTGTWSYLKDHIPGAAGLPNQLFNLALVGYFGLTRDGNLNLEAMRPPPLFTVDDHWWFATLASTRDPVSGLTEDAAPPYAPYAANANHDTPSGNPFAHQVFRDRWYGSGCTQ